MNRSKACCRHPVCKGVARFEVLSIEKPELTLYQDVAFMSLTSSTKRKLMKWAAGKLTD